MDKYILDDIVKKIKGKLILDHISFETEPGTALGIIGQNGAGKSTLLKIMAGLFKPTSGDITFNGVSVTKGANQIMDKVGFLIEDPSLYSYLPGRQSLDYCMTLRGANDKTYEDTIIER